MLTFALCRTFLPCLCLCSCLRPCLGLCLCLGILSFPWPLLWPSREIWSKSIEPAPESSDSEVSHCPLHACVSVRLDDDVQLLVFTLELLRVHQQMLSLSFGGTSRSTTLTFTSSSSFDLASASCSSTWCSHGFHCSSNLAGFISHHNLQHRESATRCSWCVSSRKLSPSFGPVPVRSQTSLRQPR